MATLLGGYGFSYFVKGQVQYKCSSKRWRVSMWVNYEDSLVKASGCICKRKIEAGAMSRNPLEERGGGTNGPLPRKVIKALYP